MRIVILSPIPLLFAGAFAMFLGRFLLRAPVGTLRAFGWFILVIGVMSAGVGIWGVIDGIRLGLTQRP